MRISVEMMNATAGHALMPAPTGPAGWMVSESMISAAQTFPDPDWAGAPCFVLLSSFRVGFRYGDPLAVTGDELEDLSAGRVEDDHAPPGRPDLVAALAEPRAALVGVELLPDLPVGLAGLDILHAVWDDRESLEPVALGPEFLHPLYHRVEKDSKTFGRLFVHFRWK
jgi:hypothetical protein